MAWEKSLSLQERKHAERSPAQAELSGTTGIREFYNVLPIVTDDKVIWVDAAGYELAYSIDAVGSYNASDIADDYVLEANGPAIVRRTFTSARHR